MIQRIFLCVGMVVLLATDGRCQSGLLLLQKGRKTLRTYFPGNTIQFTASNGNSVYGVIEALRNDSIFVKEQQIRQMATNLGVFVLDTITTYRVAYPIQQIAQLDRVRRGFNWAASGAALAGGGSLLALGSGVVYLVDRERYSSELMIAGLAGFATGYVMAKSYKQHYTLGRKYRLVYVAASTKQP